MTYIINETLPTIKQVQIVYLKEFVIAMLVVDSKTFVVHVTIWKRKEMPVHSKKQAQVGALLFNKTFTKVLVEYSDYIIFFQ